MLAVTGASVVLFLVESLPHFWRSQPTWCDVLEDIFGGLFTVDYLVRLVTARVWYRWIIKPFSLVDLISTVPFWLYLALKGFVQRLAVLRVVRLLRVFRVIRFARYSPYVEMLTGTLSRSFDALLLLLLVLVVIVVFYSSILFFSEQTGQQFNTTDHTWYRKSGAVSPFQSIFSCMWFCIVTVTTVGYGDTYPVTLLGKLVASTAMVTGVVMIAFPIAVLGNNFANTWSEYQSRKLRSQLVPVDPRLIMRRKIRVKLQELRELLNAESDLRNANG